jgi:hypothetical protein
MGKVGVVTIMGKLMEGGDRGRERRGVSGGQIQN